jgi:polyisoprenyl-phosphate glycosyltransferase
MLRGYHEAGRGSLMEYFPIFLSVVMVIRNRATELPQVLAEATAAIGPLVADYELVVVDNGSEDDSLHVLKQLAAGRELPNLQVYALTKEVDQDTAAWAGLENALGDYVAVIDVTTDSVQFIQTMLEQSVGGADSVFAANTSKPPQSLMYAACFGVFNLLYKAFSGIHLQKDAPQFRILSKRVVNFILQHAAPVIAYRHLPATSGFARVNLTYTAKPKVVRRKRLLESVDRGVRTLVSTTRGPMRLVTALSLFGAASNALYSVYVVGIAIFKKDVAAGWVTLSLQQSGMFLLLSLVLLVMGEYMLHLARRSIEGPAYHVAQEFTSAVMTRREKLNVEDAQAAGSPKGASLPPMSPT